LKGRKFSLWDGVEHLNRGGTFGEQQRKHTILQKAFDREGGGGDALEGGGKHITVGKPGERNGKQWGGG